MCPCSRGLWLGCCLVGTSSQWLPSNLVPLVLSTDIQNWAWDMLGQTKHVLQVSLGKKFDLEKSDCCFPWLVKDLFGIQLERSGSTDSYMCVQGGVSRAGALQENGLVIWIWKHLWKGDVDVGNGFYDLLNGEKNMSRCPKNHLVREKLLQNNFWNVPCSSQLIH